MSPSRPYASRSSRETFPVKLSINSEHLTVQRAPEYRARDMGPILLPPPPRAGSVGPIPLPPPPRPSAIGPIPRDIGPILKDMGPIPLPPPPYQSGRPPLSAPRGRVFSAPDNKFDPQLEACFPLIFDHYDKPGRALGWEPVPLKLVKELKDACALYGPKAPYIQASFWKKPQCCFIDPKATCVTANLKHGFQPRRASCVLRAACVRPRLLHLLAGCLGHLPAQGLQTEYTSRLLPSGPTGWAFTARVRILGSLSISRL